MKPYIFWDVSINADLWTRTAHGPLIVAVSNPATAAELQAVKNLIAQTTKPILFDEETTAFQQAISYGSEDVARKGVRIPQHEFMPKNLEYGLPGPDPYDESDLYGGHQFRFANLGYQLMLRGWAGTIQEGALTGEFQISWSDETIRSPGDVRGAWTGMLVDISNRDGERTDHKFDVLHGKRKGDTDWYYHGGHLDRVPGGPESVDENSFAHNSVSSSVMKVIISGGAPLWTILVQKKNGTVWDDVYTTSADLRSHLTGDLDEVALILSLFSGVSIDQPAVLPSEILHQVIWGTEFELSQFEPWVIDTSNWKERDWDEHWKWLTGSTQNYWLEIQRPKTDLMHSPMGTSKAPDVLRESDADLGICLKTGPQTRLRATGIADNRYIDPLVGPEPQPLTVCDVDMFGYQAPFAAYMRSKLLAAGTWGVERNLFSFGNAYTVTPTPTDNGLGIYWKPTTATQGKFVARCYDSVSGWVEIETEEAEAAQWSDKPLDIGIAWTGSRGVSSGLEDKQLRIVVNGVTMASAVIDNFTLASTKEMHVGADQTKDGALMLFRSMAVYGDAVTDYDLTRAFVEVQDAFGNPSYETPDQSSRPGEADFWNWFSLQAKGAWAEFNAYDEALEQWRTATEMFGPGWFDLQNWITDLSDTDIISAIFNGGSTSFEALFEMFGFWGKDWPSLEWVGPPWRDDFVFLQPATDVLGYDNGPTGFNGWYDTAYMTNFLPNEREEFGDAYGTDPFSTSADSLWYPGTARDGYIKSKSIQFPLSVPPDKNLFVIWVDGTGALELNLEPGTYGSAAALVTELNSLLAAYYSNDEALYFDTWSEGGESGLIFANAVDDLQVAATSLFGCREDQKSNDARVLLGFAALGHGGKQSEFRAMRWMLGDLHGENSDDIFCLDSWSLLDFITSEDQHSSDFIVSEYGNVAAIFDSGTPADKSAFERFTLVGWFGAGAIWQTGYESGETPGPTGIDAAMFDSGSISFENFDAAEWPNEIWT